MDNTTKPRRKPGRPPKPDPLEVLRQRLAEVPRMSKVPTQEEIGRAFNALLDALGGK